jgi:hypothetical protein
MENLCHCTITLPDSIIQPEKVPVDGHVKCSRRQVTDRFDARSTPRHRRLILKEVVGEPAESEVIPGKGAHCDKPSDRSLTLDPG